MQSAEQVENIQAAIRGPWCALHTRHQHEGTVARILTTKGVEVFLPTYRTVHRWKDRKKQLELPLFPGYLFFTYESERRIQVLSTPGVHTILMTGANTPAEIPQRGNSGHPASRGKPFTGGAASILEGRRRRANQNLARWRGWKE